MDGAPDTTTVMVVSLVLLALVLAVVVVRWRRARPAFLTVTEQATYETLHTASLAGRHLADGFTDEGCERAAPYLRAMLGTPGLAMCDTRNVIVWEGEGRHHLPAVMDQTGPALTSGRTVVLDPEVVTCGSGECPIRAAVIAPVTVDGHVLGTLAAFGPTVSAGLTRATEEVASWVAA